MKLIQSLPIARLLLLFIVMGAIFSYGMWKPLYNWDMIAYVAAAQDNTSVGNNKLSQETYSEISQVVSHSLFNALTTMTLARDSALPPCITFCTRRLTPAGFTHPIRNYSIRAHSLSVFLDR